MEVPPPFTNLQASREEEGGEQPGRRSLEGVGGVLGPLGKIFGDSLFTFNQESVFDDL